MILAYYRLGKYEDARRSMQQLLTFARRFRMDNPLTDFGNDVYQPKQPINITYDAFGPPAALIRGLFEYLYTRRRPEAWCPTFRPASANSTRWIPFVLEISNCTSPPWARARLLRSR